MSLTAITQSALSALKTNQAALGVVSNNVSNINTVGYARRVVNEQTLAANGTLAGVDIATVQRVADQFLTQETLSASGSSAQYDTQSSLFSQLNGLLGAPGDSDSLSSTLSGLSAAFATASQTPTASASRTGVVNALQNLASSISGVSSTISGLQGQIDQQVATSVSSTNALIKQVYDLNMQIKTASAAGDTASGLLDQRDVALQSLSQTIGVRVTPQSDGSVSVSTADGINLVSATYAQLSYAPGASGGVYGAIQIQDTNPQNGQAIGNPQALDPHLSGGSLKGLIDMRDNTLGGLAQSLGALAQQTALAFNAQNNANAAYPPPTTLSGRDTGLLSTDALNFSGKTTIAVANASGNLVSRIDVDFSAGKISVDGGTATSFTGTIGGFTAALNTALGANGTASFVNGALTVSATGTKGVIIQDNASTPSSRGGTGLSQFFGLNDLFQSSAPSILATGLSASDSSGLAAGGQISLALKGSNGETAKQVSITTIAGQTVGNVISALNTALGGAASFTLNSDGSISQVTAPGYAGYQLDVTGDTTARGTTGLSFTELFGIGANQTANQAIGFSVNPAVVSQPTRVGFGTPQIGSSTAIGDSIVTGGDSSGAIALENVGTATQSFAKAGGIAAQVSSLDDYAAAFYQSVSTQSNAVTANQTAQDDRLQEAQSRQSANSGVNLDEELTNLSTYQQAYSASARILSVVDQLYATLLQIQ